MSDTDELIKAWLKAKFLDDHRYYPETMGSPEYIHIISVDSEWECGCYSDYTRDDRYTFTAEIQHAQGVFKWTWGSWGDLPQFMQEIADMDEPDCPYMLEDWRDDH